MPTMASANRDQAQEFQKDSKSRASIARPLHITNSLQYIVNRDGSNEQIQRYQENDISEKKTSMDDVLQSEERTTTAPKVYELSEVDTTEEIVLKRKEEEIAIPFAEFGSKELYLAGLAVKNGGNMTWVIHDEKRDEIRDRVQQSNTSLPYPCLITALCMKAGMPRINRIDRGNEILSTVDQSSPAGTSAPVTTSVPDVPATTSESVPATSVGTSSIPAAGQGIPSHSIQFLRLVDAKVTKLVEEFSAYVKKAIETTLAPHKEDFESVREEQKSISPECLIRLLTIIIFH
ncbi:hypothetical protein K7X08_035453 [Anisodus acutangulus]|uniref:Uncharacterized protein n=1 Tax=Anisodus acutangulus TaxID=402998 RepID=A0A9Q1LH94_9SOLA|nr:hypothetical protein K7X08_035453 [Anisodus acutangulus]